MEAMASAIITVAPLAYWGDYQGFLFKLLIF
jgi:hypothetical protein